MSTSLAVRRRKTILGLMVTVLVIGLAMLAVASPLLLRREWLRRADEAIRARQYQASLRWLDKAAHLGQQHSQVQLLLARAYRHLDQPDDAAMHLKIAEANGLPAHLVDLELKLAQAQSGHLQEVQSYLGNMLVIPDDRVEVYEAFVRGFLLQRRFKEADDMLNDWGNDAPRDPWQSIFRGHVHAGQNDWEKAAVAYRQAIEKDETVAEAHYQLGRALRETGQTAEAKKHFARCLELTDDHLPAHVELAKGLLEEGKTAEATAMLKKAAELNARDDRVQFGFAATAFAENKYQEAYRHLQPVLETWPDDEQACLLAAKILEKLGRQADAEAMQEKAKQAAETLDKDVAVLLKAASEQPNADVRYEVGMLLYNHRSRAEGIAWIEAALLISSMHREARQTLIDYYERIGMKRKAQMHRQLMEVLPQ